jgi:hypothetical protein
VRDPHIVELRYRLTPLETEGVAITFHNPPPLVSPDLQGAARAARGRRRRLTTPSLAWHSHVAMTGVGPISATRCSHGSPIP